MRRAELTRADLIDWLGSLERGDHPSTMPLRSQSERSDVGLVWLDGEDAEPLLAVDPSEMREFLAFASTYVGTHVPFTAFFRVIPRPLVEFLPMDRRTRPTDVVHAFVGATIADAALQIGSLAPRTSEISVQAGLATPSAVVLSAYLLGYSNELALVALDRWHHVRGELGGTAPRTPIHRLRAFWGTVLSILAPDGGSLSRLPEATYLLDVARNHPDLALNAGPGAFANIPELSGLEHNLKGSREERVRALDQVSIALQRSQSTPETRELILGFVSAQVAEGSLSYLPLASRFANELPLAVLWFGLFAGMSRSSDVLTAGDCLGRRLLRTFNSVAGTLPPVQADLSFEEFLLLNQEGRIPKLRTDQQSVIDVELLPGISGRFRSSRTTKRDEETSRSQVAEAVKSPSLDQARKLVAQLQALLREADAPARATSAPLFDSFAPEKKPASLPRPRAPRRKSTK